MHPPLHKKSDNNVLFLILHKSNKLSISTFPSFNIKINCTKFQIMHSISILLKKEITTIVSTIILLVNKCDKLKTRLFQYKL